MATPLGTLRTRVSRSGLKFAGVFAVLLAVAIVMALTAFNGTAPDESPSRVAVAKTSTPAAATMTPTPAATMTPTAAASGAKRLITVVGVGDSVTAGQTCKCKTFVALYATGLAATRDLRTSSVNLGVGGWTSSQLLTSLTTPGAFRNRVATSNILLVTIGANDLVPLELAQATGCRTTCYSPLVRDIGQNVELIVAAARAAQPGHPPTILVTTYWNVFQDGDVGTSENGGAFQSWSDTLTRAANGQICEAATRVGATCVDLYTPFKGDGSKNPTDQLAADGDHPNSAGHQLIASALLADTPPAIR